MGDGGGISRYVISLSGILSVAGAQIHIIVTHANAVGKECQEEIKSLVSTVRVYCLDPTRPKFERYWGILKQIWKINPDVLISNYDAASQKLLPFLPPNCKLVHILHNDTDDFYRIGKINAFKTRCWIAPTRSIADNFNKYTGGKYNRRIKVIAHGVNPGADAKPSENPLSWIKGGKEGDTRLKILYTGVLYEHKGVREIPAVVKELQKRGVDFTLTIIGKGIEESYLRRELNVEIKKGIVEMTGLLAHDAVYRHMAGSDIFYYPTHLDAFGLVIAEAMANGAVPVVGLIPGVTDQLIENGVEGYLVSPGDILGYSDAICALAESSEMRKVISFNAIKKAKEKFSIEAMGKAYLECLNDL